MRLTYLQDQDGMWSKAVYLQHRTLTVYEAWPHASKIDQQVVVRDKVGFPQPHQHEIERRLLVRGVFDHSPKGPGRSVLSNSRTAICPKFPAVPAHGHIAVWRTQQ